MARIRSIKPEFWTSEQIVDCSPSARLMFVGMWTFSDDAGRHPASLSRLKMEIFPSDSFSNDKLQGWVNELINAGLVRHYVVDGKGFWQITGWHHQKIDHPTVRYPPPPPLCEHSPNTLGTLGEASGRERSGEESKGSKGDISPLNPLGDSKGDESEFPEPLNTEAFRQAWDDWKQHRREIKTPMTPTSTKNQLKRCAEWGEAKAIAAINTSISNGWKGLFEPKEDRNGHRNNRTPYQAGQGSAADQTGTRGF